MTRIIDPDRINEVVRKSISEALALPIEKVIPTARLISDLNAESIDIADIRFRIEDGLDIRIDQRELTAAIGAGISAEEFDSNFTVQSVIDYVASHLIERR